MSYVVSMSSNGRISLPAEVRKRLGLKDGSNFILNETPDGLELRTLKTAIAKSQAIAAKFSNTSVDEFLANRRKDSGE